MLITNNTLETLFCFFFVDVDECAVGSDCDEHASCLNTNGSYVCTCIPPYTGDGKKCAGMGKKNIRLVFPRFCIAQYPASHCGRQLPVIDTYGGTEQACFHRQVRLAWMRLWWVSPFVSWELTSPYGDSCHWDSAPRHTHMQNLLAHEAQVLKTWEDRMPQCVTSQAELCSEEIFEYRHLSRTWAACENIKQGNFEWR